MTPLRTRQIRPEFWDREDIGRLSAGAALTLVGLWCLADDEGRLLGRAHYVEGKLYPFNPSNDLHVGDWLAELEREGLIVRFEARGHPWIAVREWRRWQKISRPRKSRLPAPPVNPEQPSGAEQGGVE